MEVDATCRDNLLAIKSQGIETLHVLLDERLIDYAIPVAIDANGVTSSETLRPSLCVMCETLADRGDPEFMFATRVIVRP